MPKFVFTNNFKLLMKWKNLAEFARKSGINEGTLRSYKKGVLPRLDNLLAIAKTAGVSLLWLAAGGGSQYPEEKETKENLAERLIKLQNDFPQFEITAKPRLERESQTETQVDIRES